MAKLADTFNITRVTGVQDKKVHDVWIQSAVHAHRLVTAFSEACSCIWSRTVNDSQRTVIASDRRAAHPGPDVFCL